MERNVTNQSHQEREVWVDNVKVFACMAVLIGHLVQGLDVTGVFPSHMFYLWFNQTLYAFHVQLFFICSGYLYQKNSCVRDFNAWKTSVLKKLLDLGVPYVSFTSVVWIVKKVIPGAGTNSILSLWENLLLDPIPPFWYLYVLFLCFLITPTFRTGKALVFVMPCTVVVMLVSKLGLLGENIPNVLGYFFPYYSWFLAGMGFALVKPERVPKVKWLPLVLTACFLLISYRHRYTGNRFAWLLGSIMICSAVVLYYFWKEKQGWFAAFLYSYTMPVFLMHAVFIAVCRTLLLKCGITNLYLHLVLGVVCGVGGPIITAQIMKKLKYPEFFLYPRKFIR